MVSLGGRDLASLCGAVCPVRPERVLHALTVGHQAGKLFCKHPAHLSLQLAIVRLKTSQKRTIVALSPSTCL